MNAGARGGANAQPRAQWRLVTHSPPRGALAAIDLSGPVSDVLFTIGLGDVPPGRVALRRLAGADEIVVARWSEEHAYLFPHAGPAAIKAVCALLEAAGSREAQGESPPTRLYSEASSELEARVLAAIASATSPLAIDLLLDQPRRWSSGSDPLPAERAFVLRRILHPPTIAVIGPPNVGKSSLLNTLAGRTVSLVADEPGTTRDHVGVGLNLGGLVVHWIDCPGFDARRTPGGDVIQAESQALARMVAAEADLLVSCGDAASGFLPDETVPAVAVGTEVCRVTLRADLGLPAGATSCLAVSAKTGEGMDLLTRTLRERLVPRVALEDPRPWRFW